MLADLESLERRVVAMEKKAKGGDKEAKELLRARRSAASPNCARAGRRARPGVSREEHKLFQSLGLLSSKPVLYVCNVEEGLGRQGQRLLRQGARAGGQGGRGRASSSRPRSRARSPCCRRPSRRIISRRSASPSPGLNRVIRAGYDLLHLVTFFTVGPKEARAWTVEKGARAPQAAGVIHTDFEKGFIRAETIAYDDYVACKGEAGAREAGKFRLEGKDYVVARRRRPAFPLRQLRRRRWTGSISRTFRPAKSSNTATRWSRAEEIVEFAREFDPQPFHLDAEAARELDGGRTDRLGLAHRGDADAHELRRVHPAHRQRGRAGRRGDRLAEAGPARRPAAAFAARR